MWLRLRQIALLTEDLAGVVDHLHALFGLEVGLDDPAIRRIGLENRVIPVGTQFLEVITPLDAATTQARYLARRGDSGYMVICQSSDRDWPRSRAAELSVRIVGGSDDDAEARHLLTQFHPKDTGGSFLEIDWHADGDAPIPPWEHGAGFEWQQAIRTHRVRSIVGAEIQADDPQSVARRWSEVLELPVATSAPGRLTIQLDNASVDFVDATDSRGDGLSAVELEVVDREPILAAAADRGLLDEGGEIRISGMAFRLRNGG